MTAVLSKDIPARPPRGFGPKSAVRSILGLSGMRLALQFRRAVIGWKSSCGRCGQLQGPPVMKGHILMVVTSIFDSSETHRENSTM